MFKKVVIRPFNNTDSIDELTKLLNDSYQDLVKLGFHPVAATQNSETTIRRIAEGVCFIALLDEKIIGTILFYPPGKSELIGHYENKFATHFGQFAVENSYRKLNIGGQLLDYIENLSKKLNATEITLDTPETAYHLINYYSKKGYNLAGFVNWDSTNYRSVIMNKILI
jgi:GNAT superfamily N-acetyltransferase